MLIKLTVDGCSKLMIDASKHYLSVLLHYKLSLKIFLSTDVSKHKDYAAITATPMCLYTHVIVTSTELIFFFRLFFRY